MLWDLLQQYQISNASADAEGARARAGAAEDETRKLRRDVDRLTLACLAMWQILQSRTNLTDEDLRRIMHELDASDGRVDGRIDAGTPGRCAQCDRPVLKGKARCTYCGAEVVGGPTPFH